MKKPFTVPSSDGIHTLAGVIYFPEKEPIGYFQIVHGMCEHIGRYDRFMSELCELGYIVFGYDHLGHGHTAKDKNELGYIAEKDGWKYLCQDVKVFSDAVIQQCEEIDRKTLPYYLLGHSMGSFITRLAAESYVKPDKYICMGTGGSNPMAKPGLLLIALIRHIYGGHHISKLVDRMAFGSYNQRFGGGTQDDPSPWLIDREEIRRAYYEDPFCGFPFTVSAMGDLVKLNHDANRKAWYHNISSELPILLVSGTEDPVGNYGKGVKEVCRKLTKQGKRVSYHLYQGSRHELFNDSVHEQVKNDILHFLQT